MQEFKCATCSINCKLDVGMQLGKDAYPNLCIWKEGETPNWQPIKPEPKREPMKTEYEVERDFSPLSVMVAAQCQNVNMLFSEIDDFIIDRNITGYQMSFTSNVTNEEICKMGGHLMSYLKEYNFIREKIKEVCYESGDVFEIVGSRWVLFSDGRHISFALANNEFKNLSCSIYCHHTCKNISEKSLLELIEINFGSNTSFKKAGYAELRVFLDG